MTGSADDEKVRRLLNAGRALVAELGPEAVLDRILEEARHVTGARYAALGVLNKERSELERFLSVGVDTATRRAIGDLPRGRGVLGVLIDDPRPLRLRDVGEHPQSYGFPAGHPPMRSFLGVPIVIRGQAWGNLYLAEKEDGQFTDADEETIVILADWAATAIENARLYEVSEHRRGELERVVSELERVVRGLEATRDVAIAIGTETRVDRVLELIAKRGRTLVDARTMLILLRDGEELLVAASAGNSPGANGRRLVIADSTSGQVLEQRRSERIGDVTARLATAPAKLGIPDARTGLLVPMLHRGEALGVLAAFDRGPESAPFSDDDEQLMSTFAATAANAVAMAQSVESSRLRSAIASADAERHRWARELHDETLQSLGALRVLLGSALRQNDAAEREQAMRQAIADIEEEIHNLRAMITDLRPSMLDDLGLLPAIEALLERRRDGELEIMSELAVPAPERDRADLDPELETTVYRLVQEALTNVAKHARARTVRVQVIVAEGNVTVEVQDDGVGFDVNTRTPGFGLAGMRERVYLAGGTLEIETGPQGTLLRARLPARNRRPSAKASGTDQVTS